MKQDLLLKQIINRVKHRHFITQPKGYLLFQALASDAALFHKWFLK
jgi:hypothetical protein